MNYLRDNVKKLCTLQGITQKKLAEKIGITDSAMNITLGRDDPKFSSVKRIATALGVGVDLLTSDDIEKCLADQVKQENEAQVPQQGLFCPHCGKPLTLFVKAENVAEKQ